LDQLGFGSFCRINSWC